MNREYYARYNKQLSKKGIDGVKHVIEKGWFTKGTLVLFNGFRRDNIFMAKTYGKRNKNNHQLYKITKINEDGSVEITNKRWGETDEG